MFGSFQFIIGKTLDTLAFRLQPKLDFIRCYHLLTFTNRYLTGGYLGSRTRPDGSTLLALCVPEECLDRNGAAYQVVVCLSSTMDESVLANRFPRSVNLDPTFSLPTVAGRPPAKLEYKLARRNTAAQDAARQFIPHSRRSSLASQDSVSSSDLTSTTSTSSSQERSDDEGHESKLGHLTITKYVEWRLSAWERGQGEPDTTDVPQVDQEKQQGDDDGEEEEEAEADDQHLGLQEQEASERNKNMQAGRELVSRLLECLPQGSKKFRGKKVVIKIYYDKFKPATPRHQRSSEFELLSSHTLHDRQIIEKKERAPNYRVRKGVTIANAITNLLSCNDLAELGSQFQRFLPDNYE
ncbi:hypothetical protein BGZ74_002408 [Mortierella antarctica]|nr:hypothetical protein BGZ74_002408 [Mortierella antarctica]